MALTARADGPVKANNANAYPRGLDGRVIVVGNSHGLYFEDRKEKPKTGEWTTQRAPVQQTMEDVYTSAYVIDLLAPMLENAGAYVMMPRERDTSTHEVLIDADAPKLSPGFSTADGANKWQKSTATGFKAPSSPLMPGTHTTKKNYVTGSTAADNPFKAGSVMQVLAVADAGKESTAVWNAPIPEAGEYMVYISYATLPESASAVKYTVNSLRGSETFTVNQTMGGGTWIPLGQFPFAAGTSELPLVTLTNATDAANAGKVVTADAVRIGGGIGNVARGLKKDNSDAKPSRMPRWLEGAAAWTQYAGAPPFVYSSAEKKSEYNNDMRARPLYANWLAGGSKYMPKEKGLGIPVDLFLSFHSDAHTTPDSTIIGTLGIATVTYKDDNGRKVTTLGDGRSRENNKTLITSITNQIVSDIRTLHEPIWEDRKVKVSNYAEARLADMPSAILESMSHQNFADMRHGHNPQFRFDYARAVYKGILKYLAGKNGKYVVQPLPVNSFAITSKGSGKYLLKWEETVDSIEPTATPKVYDVEMRIGDGVFRPYKSVTSPKMEFEAPEKDVIYSFRVIARNDGGRSFPSEVLSLCHSTGYQPEVLVVNAFTRVSAPEWFETPEEAGYLDMIDHGVPYMREIAYIGSQYDFDRTSEWEDDYDKPGYGASHRDHYGKTVAGNTFDFVYTHGKAIAGTGYPFISASVDGYTANLKDYKDITMLDLIGGKQREVRLGNITSPTAFKLFTPQLKDALEQLHNRGGSILVSGSYIGSDIYANPFSTGEEMTADIEWARRVLGIELDTSHAAVSGAVDVLPFWSNGNRRNSLNYNSKLSEKIYITESPDAIISIEEKEGHTIMLYDENGHSAGVAISRVEGKNPRGAVIAMGYPFETIISEASRQNLMDEMLLFLLPIHIAPYPAVPTPDPVTLPHDLRWQPSVPPATLTSPSTE